MRQNKTTSRISIEVCMIISIERKEKKKVDYDARRVPHDDLVSVTTEIKQKIKSIFNYIYMYNKGIQQKFEVNRLLTD